ncbi:Ankyrin repeat protein nuc-2 [Phlyctema vagabunda]|uniref:Ankyrin repeat protein nuc-2 n=1 Tax=Phlyctema vagabunda TaxID=108571 RepID=A0ABR4PGJ7_9HELO
MSAPPASGSPTRGTATTGAESPTTVRPLEMDDDDVQESGTLSNDATVNPRAATVEDEAPPKPPRPLSPQQQSEQTLKEAFPSIDGAVIKAVLMASGGRVEPAFNALLGMSDPDAVREPTPPPQPPRPTTTRPGSTPQSQLEADEQYARQLAEHYGDSGVYGSRGPGVPRGRQQTGLTPDEAQEERSFLDDDLPIIKENLRKGFLETQTKFNGWITNLKKKIDGEDEEEEPSHPARQGYNSGPSYRNRRSGDGRQSGDYNRYDADPQVLGDDFAGMQLNSDGSARRSTRPLANPDLFKPTPNIPKPAESRKVGFKDGPPDDIDLYRTSPKVTARDATAGKQSKWQPLSTVDPSPVGEADNDPFSLGDSEDEKESKDRVGGKEIKMEDTERLKKAAAEAMSENIAGPATKPEPAEVVGTKDKIAEDKLTGKAKFGKQIQKRQLEVPEYAASFVNYKALKKLIKKLSATPVLLAQNDIHRSLGTVDSQAALQANKATFFFQLERELEKVNAFYLQKEAELKIRLKTLLDKKKVLQSRSQNTSRRSAKFTTLEEGFQQFGNDLNKLQQFVEINGTAFSKILKKWDKTSKSKTKELYLSRAVEVQPFFNATVISELSDQATTSLQELGAWSEGDHISFERSPEHIVSSQHLLGTDEGDADTLLLEAVISGNLESLKDLLLRLKTAADPNGTRDVALMERITRTFLAAINEGPSNSLQLLLDTGLVDIQSEDDINERNCLHQATIYGNGFVLGVGLSKGVSVSRTDVYGRVPLHYACMHGRLDMMEALLNADQSTIDLIDHDNFTPLIHAIIHGHLECAERLLARSARIDPTSDADHVPLNLACEHGSVAIVELLLKHHANIIPDAEGLYPQHLVARSGQTPQLLLLLKDYGANMDQIDKLYSWTPLFHAASEGNVPCLKTLLEIGVKTNVLDEKDLSAMYYAAWEGHLECMRLLSSIQNTNSNSRTASQGTQLGPILSSTAPLPMSIDSDGIPELELPPPIIPLRRYGHNFLDTKTFIQISFEENGEQPMIFFHDSKYPAARLTISSKLSDLIPKNILLPFQEDTRLVSFQIDNLDSFAIDFDVFPTYGAKVIAKTVALPSTFRALLSSSGRCCLPLFDPRLRAIGQITFNFQVIKPFQGLPLEITDFETYWKATSQFDHRASAFITGSSLSGDYVQLYIQHTCDGIPVLWPRWTIEYMDIEFPVSRLTYEQFVSAGSRHANKIGDLSAISELPLESIAEVHQVLAKSAISLQDALSLLPRGMHANLQILYPSVEEEKTLRLGPTVNVNTFSDAILGVVFDHARKVREQAPDSMRSLVFSSYNPTVCTALNWKQPNYPVFLCNDLGRESSSSGSIIVQSSGRRTTSIKEAVRIAQSNNFMGLICCSRLLDMIPALIEAIKSQGLVLVTDKSAEVVPDRNIRSDPFPRLPDGIDGVLKANGVLRFNETIDM